jgi:hypothetical protein
METCLHLKIIIDTKFTFQSVAMETEYPYSSGVMW